MAGNFEFVANLNGSNTPPAVWEFPVAGSQTLVIGDAVQLTSGQVAKGSTSFGRALGVMAQDSDGADANTLVKVYIATPTQLWRATATADASTYILDSRAYDLNSSQLVNVADTTGGCIQIVETDSSTTDILVSFAATEF